MLDVSSDLFELCYLSDDGMHKLLIFLRLQKIFLLLFKLHVEQFDVIFHFCYKLFLVSSQFPLQIGSFIDFLIFSHLVFNCVIQIRYFRFQITYFIRVLLQLVFNL